jgi:hypothetical protein
VRATAATRLSSICVAAVLVAACASTEGESEQAPASPTRQTVETTTESRTPKLYPIVWAVGDGDSEARSGAVVDLISSRAPSRFLYLGDVYGPYRRFYDPTWGRLAPITAPTPGEEEWNVTETPRERPPGVPAPGGNPNAYIPYWSRVHGSKQPPYYAFRLGGWEIVSLNSPLLQQGDTRQLDWLAGELSEPGTCRIAFWHHPWQLEGSERPRESVEPLWRLLTGHAVLALNGDSHSMQHWRAISGVMQLVVGTGGHGLTGVRPAPGLVWAQARDFGALQIVLERRRAKFAFVRTDGESLHAGSVRCTPLH